MFTDTAGQVPGQRDSGNRIDSRNRGNAAQLLEKYKNMARDAQMAGDRVNAEYYLQFADHYFRVLADNRARQEEQQQRFRRNDDDFSDDGDDFDGADFGHDDARGDQAERAGRDPVRDQARDQDPRQDEQRDGRGNRRDRNRRDRPSGDEDGALRLERGVEGPAGTPAEAMSDAADTAPEAEAPKPRRGRPRKADAAKADDAQGLDAAILPPSIARADNDADAEDEDAPKKRTRRPRAKAAEAAE